jgi:hypothetical protein
MHAPVDFAAGGYKFIPAVFQYSSGAMALPGHEIARVQFRSPVPLAEGFARIETIIRASTRPLTAFCGCELRSPEPVTEAGFRAFNERYVVTLKKWGLFDGGVNPVARSNVCPEVSPPAEPSFHAFCFTVASINTAPSFVIAGGAEAREGAGSYVERTVRLGDTSADGMREKAIYVLGEMERRLAAFGLTWADTTATQAYTVHNVSPVMAGEIVRRGAARNGLTWHFNRPPVRELDFEMDCRGVAHERIA